VTIRKQKIFLRKIDRGYAQMSNNAVVPSFTAFAVCSVLENDFPNPVEFIADRPKGRDPRSHLHRRR
jgi:DNA topoisomerase IA